MLTPSIIQLKSKIRNDFKNILFFFFFFSAFLIKKKLYLF